MKKVLPIFIALILFQNNNAMDQDQTNLNAVPFSTKCKCLGVLAAPILGAGAGVGLTALYNKCKKTKYSKSKTAIITGSLSFLASVIYFARYYSINRHRSQPK